MGATEMPTWKDIGSQSDAGNQPEVDRQPKVDDRMKVVREALRIFVVLNPVAGQTDPVVARQTIVDFCEAHAWQCDIHETVKDEDLRRLVRDQIKKGTDIVIAAGGDGTVSAVVSGMVNAKIPMGILPAGTGNALARDLSIPMDLPGALAVLGDSHSIQPMDIMEVSNDKIRDYYIMNVSVGISSQVMNNTPREEKRRFGFFAYIYRAIGTILHSNARHFFVKVDGKPYRFNANEVMIANCKFLGLQPQLDGVQIDPNDGCLDVFIVRARSISGFLHVFARFILRRKPQEERNIRHLEAQKSIEIRTETPMPIQADGEVIGTTPLRVYLIPSALRIIVP